MPLLRNPNLKKQPSAPRLSEQPDINKETKHERVISKRVKKDKREFKSIGDMISHVQNDVLKSDGGEIAKRKLHHDRVGHSIKQKHPLCSHCGKTCVPVIDEKKTTKSHVIWTTQVRCINCGETYEKEIMK